MPGRVMREARSQKGMKEGDARKKHLSDWEEREKMEVSQNSERLFFFSFFLIPIYVSVFFTTA